MEIKNKKEWAVAAYRSIQSGLHHHYLVVCIGKWIALTKQSARIIHTQEGEVDFNADIYFLGRPPWFVKDIFDGLWSSKRQDTTSCPTYLRIFDNGVNGVACVGRVIRRSDGGIK